MVVLLSRRHGITQIHITVQLLYIYIYIYIYNLHRIKIENEYYTTYETHSKSMNVKQSE